MDPTRISLRGSDFGSSPGREPRRTLAHVHKGPCLASSTSSEIFYPTDRKFVTHVIRTPTVGVLPAPADQLVVGTLG